MRADNAATEKGARGEWDQLDALDSVVDVAFEDREDRALRVPNRGDDAGGDLRRGHERGAAEVHSTEIREAVQEPIQQIVDAVRRALEITPPELASDIVDRGIVMTGGGALIRGLDILLAQETGLPIHVDEDPLTCVVRGTGRILDDYEKYRSVLSA